MGLTPTGMVRGVDPQHAWNRWLPLTPTLSPSRSNVV